MTLIEFSDSYTQLTLQALPEGVCATHLECYLVNGVLKGVFPIMPTVVWSRIEGNGLEYCEINTNPVTTLKGQVITQLDSKSISVSYTVQCGDEGAAQSVDLICRSEGLESSLSLSRTIDDRWFCNGKEVSQFVGLKDIDLGITPSTNTLPIRRLNLSPGESKELTAVWLRFPDLSLAPLAQRYTCIDSKTYLYQSVKSGYKAEINVDSDGIVVTYQHEWKRV